MRLEAHLSVAKAEVRGRALTRYGGVRFGSGNQVFAIAAAVGPARLWGWSITTSLEGFTEAFEGASTQRGQSRLEAGFYGARDAFTNGCDTLIERRLPDVHLVGLMIEGGNLHVMTAGAGRVYLHRGGEPKRLTPRENEQDALLKATPVYCRGELEPEDLILAGSASAFSVRAIGRIASVLHADPNIPVAALANILSEPADQAGVGAAALVLRVR